MMGIAKLETALRKTREDRNIFVPYIMAGDGGLDVLEERINFLHASGAAAIEIGIPFSDPVADGPVIQEAGKRALQKGTTLSDVLAVLRNSKDRREVPVLLMTYLNPIFSYGVKAFAEACREAGVDGIIIPDLPQEESGMITGHLKENEIAFIQLAAMTSPEERLQALANKSEGFLYAVAVTGTTGQRASHDENVQNYLELLKGCSPVPVLAGFGVSNADQARTLSSYADGVVVGSRIVQLFHEGKTEEIRTLIEESVQLKVNN